MKFAVVFTALPHISYPSLHLKLWEITDFATSTRILFLKWFLTSCGETFHFIKIRLLGKGWGEADKKQLKDYIFT